MGTVKKEVPYNGIFEFAKAQRKYWDNNPRHEVYLQKHIIEHIRQQNIVMDYIKKNNLEQPGYINYNVKDKAILLLSEALNEEVNKNMQPPKKQYEYDSIIWCITGICIGILFALMIT